MIATHQQMSAVQTPAPTFDDQIAARLLHSRIVVLGSELDDALANRICGQLLILAEEDSKRDISLWINSPGGSITAGMAIYDTMSFIPNDVATLAMGSAYSMGQFLLCTGTAGKRFSLPNSRVMMHQPSGGLAGTAADIAIQAENLAHTRKTMQHLIARHSGQDLDTIQADQRRDRWFTPEEARDYGFVDKIVSTAQETHDSTTHSFGFTAGSNAREGGTK